MRALICAFICLAAAAYLEAFEKIKTAAEYRNDVISYEEEEKYFFREKFFLYLSSESYIGLSHIFLPAQSLHSATWNICLNDAHENIKFFAGNYGISAGSGLIMGKRRYFSGDLFEQSPPVRYASRIYPDSSGNPVYSFSGAAFEYHASPGGSALISGVFASVRGRYADVHKETGIPGTENLASLSTHAFPQGLAREAVEIHDYGFFCELFIKKYFKFQTYSVFSAVKHNKGADISWPESGPFLQCGGLYALYSDSFIEIFSESGITYDGTKAFPEPGFAVSGGLTLKHDRVRFSIYARDCTEKFYAPYSAEYARPSAKWASALGVRPLNFLYGGVSLASEKKMSPSWNYSGLNSKLNSEFFAKVTVFRADSIKLSWSKAVCGAEEGTITNKQYKAETEAFSSGVLSLTGKGIVQESNSSFSWSWGWGLGVFFLNSIKADVQYNRYEIRDQNKIYSVMLPDKNAIASGGYIDKNCNAAALRFRYSRADISAGIRFLFLFDFKGYSREKIEMSAQAVF